jgi:hypothetical protein
MAVILFLDEIGEMPISNNYGFWKLASTSISMIPQESRISDRLQQPIAIKTESEEHLSPFDFID